MSARNYSADVRKADAGIGFTYAMDPTTELRQFHLSLCIIAVLGVAIVTAVCNLRAASVDEHGVKTFVMMQSGKVGKVPARS